MKLRRELLVLVTVLTILVPMSYAVITTVRANSLLVPPELPCRTEWGRPRPQEWCDERDKNLTQNKE